MICLLKTITRKVFVQPNCMYFGVLGCMCIFCLFFIHYTWKDISTFIISPCLWTLQEYWAHRFIMHGSTLPFVQYAHFKHHENIHNIDRIFIPIPITIGFALFNFEMFVFIFGYSEAFANFICNSICYMLFEFVHWNCHIRNSYLILRPLRRFHLKHHAISTDSLVQVNYGFTSASWDILFGTADETTRRNIFRWILFIPYPILPFLLVDILS
jgi:sterol desaturase/sphingolipid hydroxylase (fatty acid hydroxylase superfamily)